MQRARIRTGVDTELVAHEPPQLLVDPQRGHGVAALGQRLHEQPVTGLGQRRLLDQAARRAFGPRQFRPTDAEVAGDRLFVLERRLSLFGGWQNRIVTLPVAELPGRADDVIEPVELAKISGPVLGENYEGLTVRRVDDGSYALITVADDNFNGIQHTQLLELRWRP